VVPPAHVAGSRLALRTLVFRAFEGLGLALLNTYRNREAARAFTAGFQVCSLPLSSAHLACLAAAGRARVMSTPLLEEGGKDADAGDEAGGGGMFAWSVEGAHDDSTLEDEYALDGSEALNRLLISIASPEAVKALRGLDEASAGESSDDSRPTSSALAQYPPT
ncbi:hypothetical protein T484DRAFT_1789905, partial [Baffinella frigidus]